VARFANAWMSGEAGVQIPPGAGCSPAHFGAFRLRRSLERHLKLCSADAPRYGPYLPLSRLQVER